LNEKVSELTTELARLNTNSTRNDNDNGSSYIHPRDKVGRLVGCSIYDQLTNNNICIYCISLDGRCIGVNSVVENVSGFHCSALIGKALCSRPLRWRLFYIPTRNHIQQMMDLAGAKCEQRMSPSWKNNESVAGQGFSFEGMESITDVNDLPNTLQDSHLLNFCPSKFSIVPPALPYDSKLVLDTARQQCTHLKSALSKLPPNHGLKLLLRHSTALDEQLEAIATVCVLDTAAHRPGCFIVLAPTETRRFIFARSGIPNALIN